jgi:N-acetylglucosamine-6-phosphate deacetylase
VPGYHLEGPFLNPEPGYAGCHPPAFMRLPDPVLLAHLAAGLERPILLVTLAPERPGAMDLIRWAHGRGMLVAMGHTAADATVVEAAAAAGVRLSTHLGNALPQMQPKFLNPIMAQLAEDRLVASFIADGIHIPPPVLKVLLRANGLDRALLVTDATAAASAPPGLFAFAGMAIEGAADGSVRVPESQRLAGSGLCLDQALRNLVAWGIAPAGTAVRLASDQPASLLAPALAAHGVRLAAGNVTWSVDLHPAAVRLDGIELRPGSG